MMRHRFKTRFYTYIQWPLWASAFLLLCGLILQCKDSGTEPKKPPDSDNIRTVVILYTNDEHGWMEAGESADGAAGMMGLWRSSEGYTESGPYLVLSGGDMWTGPAISTWFHGRSMVEVMNAMGYDAAAIGNHEFDFTVDTLEVRIQESDFTYLAANIRMSGTDQIPEFATPYVIREVNGITIGIVGMASITTPWSTNPANVAGLDFLPYDQTLQALIPEVRAGDPDLIILVGHMTEREMRALAPTASALGIPLIAGGHGHEYVNDRIGSVALLQAGAYMNFYGRADIKYDTQGDSLYSMQVSIFSNTDGVPDPAVENIVQTWEDRLDDQLSHVIGYASNTIPVESAGMHNMVTDSWLWALPAAHASLTNSGGIRQSIPAGNISLETLVGVLPFENTIIQMDLTGSQLKQSIRYLLMGGITTSGDTLFLDGSHIYNDSLYRVLTNSYLYSRTDYPFQNFDPDAYDTGINYRQPVIDWIMSLGTTSSDPLNNYLDTVPRR
jgi:2',3'-cyclic-nucleotide 2'-phosphodiesterase (5'-nucleotidase family)